MVLQDTLLFSTTIKENIAYGRPGATEAQIIEAAKRAQAYDFIMKMPEGLDSLVGERGGHLSVGQRQRHRHCPGLPQGRTHSSARRTDQRPRSGYRARHHGNASRNS